MQFDSFRNGPRTPLTLVKRRLLSALAVPLLPVLPLSFGLISVPSFAQNSVDSSASASATASASPQAAKPSNEQALPAVAVSAKAAPTDPVNATYGGGQVSKGASLGVLGTQEVINVPFSVTRYTEKAIKDKQAQTVGEFLQETDPNVRVSQQVGQSAENYMIRGFQLYSDDLALNGLYGLTPRQMVSTVAVSSVTIFKGASTFLNGAPTGGTGVGGSIDVELKHADDKPLTEVSTQISGSGAFGASLDVGRRFGSDNQFGIRVNQSDQGGDTAVDKEKRYNKTTAVGLDWRGDKVRFTADFLYQKAQIDQARTTYTATGSIPAAPAATSTFAQPWTNSKLEDTTGMLGAEYDFAPGWTAYAKGGLRHTNETGQYSSPAYDGTTGLASAYRLGTHFQEDATSAAVGVRGKFNLGPVSNQVNLGASIVSVDQRSAYTFGFGAYTTTIANAVDVPYPADTSAGGKFDHPGTIQQNVNKGLSVSDTLGFLNDRILLTVGMRHQSLTQDVYDYTGTQTNSNPQSLNSPILGIVFKPLNNLSVYANRTESLVNGSTAGFGAVNYGQVFAPYRSKQFEAGVKYDEGSFGANAAVFQIKQPSAYTDPSTLVYTQSGMQRNRGVELGIYGEPMKGLRLIAGASYTDAKLTETGVAADVGNTAVGVPHYLANIGAEYDIPQLAGLTFTGQWVYTSRQFLDAANTLSIGAWSRFDLGARYTTQIYRHPVTVRATVQNVANRAYWASTYGGYLTLGSPRTFLLSLTTDF